MRKKSYEGWTTQLVENLAVYFDLAGWNILIKWDDEDKKEDGPETYATIAVNSVYQTATITFMRAARQDYLEETVDRLIQATTHEFVHVFLDPFQDAMHPFLSITSTPAFMNIVETQTQKLAMVFLKTLPQSVIPPR